MTSRPGPDQYSVTEWDADSPTEPNPSSDRPDDDCGDDDSDDIPGPDPAGEGVRSSEPGGHHAAGVAARGATGGPSGVADRGATGGPADRGRTGGRLWLVATPIGNLGDLTPRAVEVLAAAALVCCEDTRRTGRLLQHAGIRAARLAVANDHTEFHRITDVLEVLGSGRDVAVVSDAGTPGISDPGERLVRAAIDAGHAVSAVPGAAAVVTALTISGLPTDRYVFEGFIPRSGGVRSRRLADIAAETRTIVLYEAPHRMRRTLDDLTEVCGPDRRVSVARELTKMYEEVVRGTLGTIDVGEPRGEYVIVLAGLTPDDTPPDDDTIRRALRTEIADGATKKDAIATVTRRLGVPKKQVYALAITE